MSCAAHILSQICSPSRNLSCAGSLRRVLGPQIVLHDASHRGPDVVQLLEVLSAVNAARACLHTGRCFVARVAQGIATSCTAVLDMIGQVPVACQHRYECVPIHEMHGYAWE